MRKAEEEFRWCWGVLAKLRYDQSKVASTTDFIALQPRLAKAVFALEHCYHQLKKQDRLIIEKKTVFRRDYVALQLRKTRALRRLLNDCIDVGKVLGDSFAWLFYQKEYKLLREHQKHQPIVRSAIGTGGMGEITYLENLPVINNYMVIYHGTTTFLRLGDITMIDMRSFKVAAIGELKSHRPHPEHISISTTLVGKKLRKNLMPSFRNTNPRANPGTQKIPLKAQQLDRFKRQIAALHEAFRRPNTRQFRAYGDLNVIWNTEKLSELAKISNTTRFRCVKADRELLLAGLKLRESTLLRTLLNGSGTKLAPKLEGTQENAKEIIAPTLPDNRLIIGRILYGGDERYELVAGMRPILWWPLSRQIVEALIFRRLIVLTLFNPAFLIDDLRKRGFVVDAQKGTSLAVAKPFRNASLKLSGFNYFLRLVQQYLLSEAAVIGMVNNSVSTLEARRFPMPAHIDLAYEWEFQ
jgi:hypothetical protein